MDSVMWKTLVENDTVHCEHVWKYLFLGIPESLLAGRICRMTGHERTGSVP